LGVRALSAKESVRRQAKLLRSDGERHRSNVRLRDDERDEDLADVEVLDERLALVESRADLRRGHRRAVEKGLERAAHVARGEDAIAKLAKPLLESIVVLDHGADREEARAGWVLRSRGACGEPDVLAIELGLLLGRQGDEAPPERFEKRARASPFGVVEGELRVPIAKRPRDEMAEEVHLVGHEARLRVRVEHAVAVILDDRERARVLLIGLGAIALDVGDAAEIPVAAPFGLEAFGLFRSCERPVDDRARAADVTRLEPQLAEVPGGDGGELVAPRGVRGAHGAILALDRFSAKPGDLLAVARTKRLLAEKVAELDRRDDHVLRLLRVVLRARELALGEDEGALGLIERQLLRDRLLEERGRDRQSSGDAKRKRGARGTDEIGRGLRRIVELAERELEARLVEIETAVEIVISRQIARDETSSGQSLERGHVVAEAVA